MKDLAEIRDFLQNGHLNYLPHISIDCTIFGYNDRQLKLLVGYNKIIGEWWLPGGHVKKTETLEEAANRIVMERTGIDNLFLQQFKIFSDPERAQLTGADEKKWLRSLKLHGIEITKDNWLRNKRAISDGLDAITDCSRAIPQSDNMFLVDCSWFEIANIPNLEVDHNEIVKEALHTMRVQLYYYPIGYNMLPEKLYNVVTISFPPDMFSVKDCISRPLSS